MKERMEQAAEKQMAVRLRRAFRETVKPIYEAVELRTLTSEEQVETLIKKEFIERELRWLYVTWGFRMLRWFQSNYEFERKSVNWLDELERLFRVKGAKKVTEIIGTTKVLAKKAIKEGLRAANLGASIDAIQANIKRNIEAQGGLMSDGRARTIARTETISASNQATYTAVHGENLDLEKRWVTGGTNIRDSHRDCENQGWIGKDDVFINGLLHPGDPNGEAEEVINCKCVLIWRVKEEEAQQGRAVDEITPDTEVFTPASTIDEAETFAKEKLGIRIDKTDADLETRNILNQTVFNLKSKYKTDDLFMFGRDKRLGVFASANSNQLNVSHSLISKTVNTKYAEQVRTGFNPLTPNISAKQAIITHEYGHVASLRAIKGQQESGRKLKSLFVQYKNDWKKALKNNPALSQNPHQYKDFISRYALKDTHEFTAEAFLQFMHSPNPSKWALEVKKVFDQYFAI
jgi:hypothetical protein